MTVTFPDTPSSDYWELWPKLDEPDSDPNGPEYQTWQNVANYYGQTTIEKAFATVCKQLNARSKVQTEEIPIINFSDIDHLSPEKLQEIKTAGCFAVRGVISDNEAKQWYKELITLLDDNGSDIKGFPVDFPSMKRLYWTKPQLEMRSHPHQLKLQRWINALFTDTSETQDVTDTTEPLTYADKLRVSPPGTKMLSLGPHIDSGSLARWGDENYRKVYDAAFKGNLQEMNLYDLAHRKNSNANFYPGGVNASVFRSFQGWTALSSVGNRKGGLYIRPYINEVMAYVMLRPFFRPLKSSDDKDYLDPTNWIFDLDHGYLLGASANNSQALSISTHPHLKLDKTLVSIPDLEAGDSIWWHADMIHAVEIDNFSDKDVAVVYIPAVPSMDMNKKYMEKQAEAFMTGTAPPDFVEKSGFHDETLLKGYPGNITLLNEAGKRAMKV